MTEFSVAGYNFGPGGRKVDDLQVLARITKVIATQEAGDQGSQLAAFAATSLGWEVFRSTAKPGMGAVAFAADTRVLADAELHMHLAVPARWVGPKGAGPTTAKAKYIARLSGFVDGQPVHILDTHAIASWTKSRTALGKDEWEARRRHVRTHVAAIVDLAASLEGTVVLVGDLNGPPSHPLLKRLHVAGFVGWSSTATLKGRPIDQVLVRKGNGATVAASRVVGGLTSDHKARVATITLPAVPQRPVPPEEPETVTAYLVANPPARRQFKERGTTPSGVMVVHTAESTPDWVGPDAGAEAVARFIRDRSDPGSYHRLADSDSSVLLVPYSMQAYGDGTGSNPHALHFSAATQAAKWNQATKEWREATVRQMARDAADAARWLKKHHGVTVPARRITRAESERRVPGFISHGERDPGRRTDPGKDFPWDLFLTTYAAELGGTTTSEEDDMALDDKLWPNDDDSPTVRDVLRAQHKARYRLDERTKALLERNVDPQRIAAAVVAALPAGRVDEATVVAGVKRALAELVNEER